MAKMRVVYIYTNLANHPYFCLVVRMRWGKGEEKGKREETYGWLAKLRFARVHSAQRATRHAQQTMRVHTVHMYVTCTCTYVYTCMLRVHLRMYVKVK